MVEAVNERAEAVGLSGLSAGEIAPGNDVVFRASWFASLCDKINELLPKYCDRERLDSGVGGEFPLYDLIAFDITTRGELDSLSVLNELYDAVDKMRWSYGGNGKQVEGGSTSIDGDRAQQAGTPHWWARGHDTKALAMSSYPSMSTYENWDAFRERYPETNLGWAFGTIICGAVMGTYPGYLTDKWYGLFDADWGYVTSDRGIETGSNGETVLYAKLSESFWTSGRFAWKTDGPSFDGYPFSHPDGYREGIWEEYGAADRWSGKKPICDKTHNECKEFPGEQNWSINTPQYYEDNFGYTRYDAIWVVKWTFEEAS
jgi:hypothetical protein